MSIVRVAKYAGVSTATVSRVLNSVPVVSEETVRNVRAAIEALKYDPFEVKRGPRPGSRRPVPTKKAGMIALMAVGLDANVPRFHVISGVVDSITRSAKQAGVRVLLENMPDLDELSSVISEHEVDGAVVFLADAAPLDVLREMQTHVPIVWAMGGQASPLPVDHVSENNLAIGYLAHQYLYRKGCRDAAYLTIVPQKRHAMQRGMAMAAAAMEQGLYCRSLIVTENNLVAGLYGAGVTARPSLPELIDAFAALSPRPTGLFIDHDTTTARVYPLLARHGIQPGRDVTIISCDNEEIALSSLYPRPASIDLGVAELGYRVVRRLLLRIENKDEPPVFVQTMPRLQPGENDLEYSDQLAELAV
jgi:DNA-binding LacI/PurR family transcriptional regulator